MGYLACLVPNLEEMTYTKLFKNLFVVKKAKINTKSCDEYNVSIGFVHMLWKKVIWTIIKNINI